MPVEVILPKVDMDMATGRISRWFVTEGAAVKQGDLLFEIETDKAAMEIDAPADGTVRDIVGKEGVDIPVGSPVAWIYAEGERYEGAKADASALISPLVGEMSPKATEGGAVPVTSQVDGGSDQRLRCPPLACRPSPPHAGRSALARYAPLR